MSPLGKGLLASALSLPLVAFVAGVLASPQPVDPERSRPVIIDRVSDDDTDDQPTQSPAKERKPPPGDRARNQPRDPGGDDTDGSPEDGPDGGPDDDGPDDQPYTVVTPPPRDVDDDEDDGDDGDDDDSNDGGGSGGSGGGRSRDD